MAISRSDVAQGGETPEALVLAVASGKGGTGKSFLSTNLAVALSAAGKRVTLVDCDFGLGNDHLLLGVSPTRSIQHFFRGDAILADLVVPTRHGPELLPGGSGITRLADLAEHELSALGDGLATIAVRSDVLFLDSAAGIAPQGLLTLLAAHHVVVVTHPEIAAMTDAYAVIKCLASHADRPEIDLVVNRVASAAQGEATFRKLEAVSRRFCALPLHYLGSIPEDKSITQLRLDQAPIVVSNPTSAAALAIHEIARRLGERAGGFAPRRVMRTLAQRFRQGMNPRPIP
ncbi:MAG: P-loop NTPase [Planctomycetes bacterium]|nr:P-loop NTPase [Planctomycetota bacterium]MCB9870416.1 P-loop NTPase [Planctomycetota bacterium]MCB9889407.1 P-loop NTPase [Planctomycetota bacterium]